MNKESTLTTDRQRAIVEAGRLIDALTDGNGDAVKDSSYMLNKYVRPALAEIREIEGRAAIEAKQADCTGIG